MDKHEIVIKEDSYKSGNKTISVNIRESNVSSNS
jgi:hypothetical protein